MKNPDLLHTASEQFLGKKEHEIKSTVLQTLEGHLRAILGQFFSSFYNPPPLLPINKYRKVPSRSALCRSFSIVLVPLVFPIIALTPPFVVF